VTLAGEQPLVGSRPIQPAPGRVDLAPRVQIGEVALGAARAIEGFHVGLSCIRYPLTKRVASPQCRNNCTTASSSRAGPAGAGQRLLGSAAGLEANEVFEAAPEALVDADEKVDRARARITRGSGRQKFAAQRLEVGGKLRRELTRALKRLQLVIED